MHCQLQRVFFLLFFRKELKRIDNLIRFMVIKSTRFIFATNFPSFNTCSTYSIGVQMNKKKSPRWMDWVQFFSEKTRWNSNIKRRIYLQLAFYLWHFLIFYFIVSREPHTLRKYAVNHLLQSNRMWFIRIWCKQSIEASRQWLVVILWLLASLSFFIHSQNITIIFRRNFFLLH